MHQSVRHSCEVPRFDLSPTLTLGRVPFLPSLSLVPPKWDCPVSTDRLITPLELD